MQNNKSNDYTLYRAKDVFLHNKYINLYDFQKNLKLQYRFTRLLISVFFVCFIMFSFSAIFLVIPDISKIVKYSLLIIGFVCSIILGFITIFLIIKIDEMEIIGTKRFSVPFEDGDYNFTKQQTELLMLFVNLYVQLDKVNGILNAKYYRFLVFKIRNCIKNIQLFNNDLQYVGMWENFYSSIFCYNIHKSKQVYNLKVKMIEYFYQISFYKFNNNHIDNCEYEKVYMIAYNIRQLCAQQDISVLPIKPYNTLYYTIKNYFKRIGVDIWVRFLIKVVVYIGLTIVLSIIFSYLEPSIFVENNQLDSRTSVIKNIFKTIPYIMSFLLLLSSGDAILSSYIFSIKQRKDKNMKINKNTSNYKS